MQNPDSPLKDEIDAIIDNENVIPDYRLEVELTAGGEAILVQKIAALEIRRSYWTNHSDVTLIDLAILSGTFHHVVYPNKENLFVNLIWRPVKGSFNAPLDEEVVLSTRYKAYVNVKSSSIIDNNRLEDANEETMNLGQIDVFRFQLVSPFVDKARKMSYGTVLTNTSIKDALRSIITEEISKIGLEDTENLKGLDIAEPDHKGPYPQLVIPHGTPILGLPDFFQDTIGVYGTGLGNYIQNDNWFIYPLYDLTRFDKADYTLTLINIPRRRFFGIDKTYRITENQVIALVVGQVASLDLSEESQQNAGHGSRFANPDLVFEAFGVNNADNTSTISRSELISEIYTSDPVDSERMALMSKNRIRANKFAELSEMAVLKGSYISCQWTFSNIGIIEPGMPVKYMFETKGEIKEVMGVVVEAHHYMMANKPGIRDWDMNTQTALLLFVEQFTDI